MKFFFLKKQRTGEGSSGPQVVGVRAGSMSSRSYEFSKTTSPHPALSPSQWCNIILMEKYNILPRAVGVQIYKATHLGQGEKLQSEESSW